MEKTRWRERWKSKGYSSLQSIAMVLAFSGLRSHLVRWNGSVYILPPFVQS